MSETLRTMSLEVWITISRSKVTATRHGMTFEGVGKTFCLWGRGIRGNEGGGEGGHSLGGHSSLLRFGIAKDSFIERRFAHLGSSRFTRN